MNIRRLVSFAAAALAALVLSLDASAAVLIVKNVNGYTPTTQGLKKFTALVVRDGKVDRVVAAGESLPAIEGAQTLDGQGRTLLPGLIDAHGHVLPLGQASLQVDLRGSPSVSDAVGRVRKFAAEHVDARWIVGNGWNQVLWPERRFPTAHDLDAIGNRPVLLSRVDGHAIWVNSAALELAGITAKTVENHRTHICDKLDLHGPQALLRFALERKALLE